MTEEAKTATPERPANCTGFCVEAHSLLGEAREMFIDQGPAAYGGAMGMTMISAGLREIAERAVELNDEPLLAICEQLCLLHKPAA